GLTDAVIDQAFAEGTILRTHVMRPTWHFVTPADIRWLLKLTAPRVHALNATYYRKLELDAPTLKRSHAALAKALRGGQQLTRDELRAVLQQTGIATDTDFRMGYIMMHAELDGLVCSGARRGKQFTYGLLDERAPHSVGTTVPLSPAQSSIAPAPQAAKFEREAALAELARRYFTSHGPATAKDFAWWSGLTLTDAKAGIELAKPHLEHTLIDDQTYWFAESAPPSNDKTSKAYLLSIYDEYTIGYTDRSAIGDAKHGEVLTAMGNALQFVIVVDSQIVGTWKRTIKSKTVAIETNLLTRLTKAQQRALAEAARQYGAFLELSVELA
ncbi:MAG: winged helix DNA-binding domain-containing protein, partial [Anaerolineales bacterium]